MQHSVLLWLRYECVENISNVKAQQINIGYNDYFLLWMCYVSCPPVISGLDNSRCKSSFVPTVLLHLRVRTV